LRHGLKQLGLESSIVAAQIDAPLDAEDRNDVLDAASFGASLPLRGVWKVSERVGAASTLEWRFADAISRALAVLHARAPLDLFEMEESFGAAWLVQGAIPRPMIVRLHGPWCQVSPALGLPSDASYERRVVLEGRAIRDAHAVSSPSRYALDSVRRQYGLELERAEVIPNPIAIPTPDARWSYDACDKKTLLFVGRFDRVKGGDLVLDAFRALASAAPTAELVFVGPDRGLHDERGKRWSFDEYSRAQLPPEIAARIRMLGEQPASAILGLRKSSFITIVASRFETFGMTALEALAHGCPLVASAAAGIAEIVEDGKNGSCFVPGDSQDLANKLLALFRQPELASRLGEAAAKDAERRFASDVVARAMREFYSRVTARPEGTRSSARRALRSLRSLML
jgi:glycosyltransferase involved in cell wall biosynthesis